jgi:hypothetical protein
VYNAALLALYTLLSSPSSPSSPPNAPLLRCVRAVICSPATGSLPQRAAFGVQLCFYSKKLNLPSEHLGAVVGKQRCSKDSTRGWKTKRAY